MKVFNKPERAEDLKLHIIDLGDSALIRVDVQDIPEDKSIEEFLKMIKEEGIQIIDKD